MMLWVMEEASSNDPKQARKWWEFWSRRVSHAEPEEMVVGVVMALPTLTLGAATRTMEIGSVYAARGEAAAAETQMDMMRENKPKKKCMVTELPRLSPRFPHRSLCLARLVSSM